MSRGATRSRGRKQRHGPEQQRGAYHAVDAQRKGADSSGIGFGPEHALADRGVESPDDVGGQQGRMSFQFSFVHFYLARPLKKRALIMGRSVDWVLNRHSCRRP